MKRSEMNRHQIAAFDLVIEQFNWIIGGYENELEDSEPGSPERAEAEAILADHDGLAKTIYAAVMSETDSERKKAIRFAGSDFIKERIEKRLKKEGY